ncbi:MAG: hypothetical protein M5U28_19910 [Sandaracinaceae bacterium]|nr:hypothetical protein [Sandaracinaceae bacterium]
MSDHAKLVSWARGAAVCWVALICAFLLQPPELSPDISSPLKQSAEQIARFWGARPDESLVHRALHLAALAAGLAVLGVVGALSTAERRIPRWASYGGALGASVIALSNARYLAMEPTYARLFLESDAAIQPAVAVASASLALDPFGLLEWGASPSGSSPSRPASAGGATARSPPRAASPCSASSER